MPQRPGPLLVGRRASWPLSGSEAVWANRLKCKIEECKPLHLTHDGEVPLACRLLQCHALKAVRAHHLHRELGELLVAVTGLQTGTRKLAPQIALYCQFPAAPTWYRQPCYN